MFGTKIIIRSMFTVNFVEKGELSAADAAVDVKGNKITPLIIMCARAPMRTSSFCSTFSEISYSSPLSPDSDVSQMCQDLAQIERLDLHCCHSAMPQDTSARYNIYS